LFQGHKYHCVFLRAADARELLVGNGPGIGSGVAPMKAKIVTLWTRPVEAAIKVRGGSGRSAIVAKPRFRSTQIKLSNQ
jgi:hypothetical protein